MTKIFILTFIILLLPISVCAQEKTVPQSQQQLVMSYAPLVKKAAPAVVNIYTKKKVKIISPFMDDPFFKKFFGDEIDESGGMTRERIQSSLGSGVIVRAEGLIVTNNHVVSGSDEITVVLHDKREFEGKVVLSDKKTDLALVKIKASEPLPFISGGDSDALEVGDVVLAIGNPFGVGQTVTHGIVSALARTTIGISDFQFFIQTDAPINPGNSGGALIDMKGRLVGVNSAIYSQTGGSNGIGFAVPSAMVNSIIRDYERGGKIIRPWLGISAQRVNTEIARELGLHNPAGVIVRKIHRASPVEDAGIKEGDVILTVDGKEITDEQSLRFRIATYQVGSQAEFGIFRNGSDMKVKVDMQPAPESPRDVSTITGRNPMSGAVIANLTPQLLEELQLSMDMEGVVVIGVAHGTVAESLGLRKGDMLVKINDKDIKRVDDVKRIIATQPVGWALSIRRGNEILSITLRTR